MGKIEKIYFDEPSKKEKGAGITASKLPLESDKHHMERLTKMAREKRKKEEKKPPKAPKEFGGELNVEKPKITKEEINSFRALLDAPEEKAGKLKIKKAKKAIKKAIQTSVDKFEFKNVPSEQARVKKLDIKGKEVVDRIPKIEKRAVGVAEKIIDNKPFQTSTKQFQSIGEQKARLREYKPTRVAELQPSGLPTTEEYQMNPEMFQGLLPEQKYELERQIREKMGKPLMALQDISSEIKKIAPSISASVLQIMPPTAGVGAVQAPVSLLGEAPQAVVPPTPAILPTQPVITLPTGAQVKQQQKDTEMEMVLKRMIADGITTEQEARVQYKKRTGKNFVDKVKKAFEALLSETASSPPPTPTGSGLKLRTRERTRARVHTKVDKLAKQHADYQKLKRMRKALTPFQQKKLDKYKEMEGKGLFSDILKVAKEHGLPLLKKGVQAGVKYAIENPEKVKEYGKKALSFLFKK